MDDDLNIKPLEDDLKIKPLAASSAGSDDLNIKPLAAPEKGINWGTPSDMLEGATRTMGNIGMVYPAVEAAANTLTAFTGGAAGYIGGGLGGLYDRYGLGMDVDPQELAKKEASRWIYQPNTKRGQELTDALPWNKLGQLPEEAGHKTTDYLMQHGVGDDLSAAGGAIVDAASNILPFEGLNVAGRIGTAPKVRPGKPVDIPPPKAATPPPEPPPPPGPGMPDVMPVTPQGQGIMPGDSFWRQRAEQMTQDARKGQMELPLENSTEQAADRGSESQGQLGLFPDSPQNTVSTDPMRGVPEITPQVALRKAMDAEAAGKAAEAAFWKERAMEIIREERAKQNAQSLAVDREGVAGTPEEMEARAHADSVARTKPYMDERNQGLLDDGDQGYVANQYGGGQPGLRIDENGVPIRADRSMEAQNLQDPLQRNLWGDELPRQSAQEATRGITAAIDRMPPGEARDAGLNQLGKPLPRSPGGRQRGAVNMDLFTPGFEKLKMINNGIQLRLKGGFDPIIQAIDRYGKQVGELKLNTDTFEQKESSNLQAGYVHVEPAMRGKGIAEQMYKFAAEHGDVQADMGHLLDAGKKMWEGFEKKGLANSEWTIPRSQRGAIDTEALSAAGRAFNRKVEQVADKLRGLNPFTPKEQILGKAVGEPYMAKPESPEEAIAKAAQDKDGPSLFNRMQSGLTLASEKTGSYAQKYIARSLLHAEKIGDYFNNKVVTPTARAFARLNDEDLVKAWKVFQQERQHGARYDQSELDQHLPNKNAQEAYTRLRNAHDDALEKLNAGRAAQGKPPIDAHTAFMASNWGSGQWHVPLMDASGNKMLWMIRAQTKGEAVAAIKWLKENTNLPVDKLKPKFLSENFSSKAPSDVLGAYRTMIDFFEGDPVTQQNIKQAAQGFAESQGFKFLNHDVHFLNRSEMEGVRGYLGDRPWLSEKQNAAQGIKSQLKYLRDSYRWAPMNDALSNVSKVLNAPELKDQPNNLQLARMYTTQAMGATKNQLRWVENEIQKITTAAGIGDAGNLPDLVHSLKTMTYLTQLAGSLGYMITTPLQSIVLGPSWHRTLSNEGPKHNPVITAAKTVADMGGLVGKPFTEIGKKAFQWMHDNGVINNNVFSENAGLGDYAPVHAAKVVLGQTISIPEMVARASTFLSFVHHLNDAGFGTHEQIFQKAEEFTNHTLTDFRRASRPILADQLGQLGELAYTYKSPIFNYYNSMSKFGRDFLAGKPGPFIMALMTTQLMSGLLNFPGVQELENGGRWIKDWVAEHKPAWYPAIRDVSVKRFVMEHANEAAANQSFQDAVGGNNIADFLTTSAKHGIMSAATGAQLGTRFGANLGDPNNLLSNFAPALQEGKEALSAGATMLEPNSTTMNEALWQQLPPMGKGTLENQSPAFNGGMQGNKMGMLNPNHLENQSVQYFRTPHEQNLRYGGLTSNREYEVKQTQFENEGEKARWEVAQHKSIDKLFDAIVRTSKSGGYPQDKADIIRFAQSYVQNYGTNLEAELDKKVENYTTDPQQRAVIHAQTLSAVEAIKRYLETRGGNYAN